jgi:hypothetical protein
MMRFWATNSPSFSQFRSNLMHKFRQFVQPVPSLPAAFLWITTLSDEAASLNSGWLPLSLYKPILDLSGIFTVEQFNYLKNLGFVSNS